MYYHSSVSQTPLRRQEEASGGAAVVGEREDFSLFRIWLQRIWMKSSYFLDSEEFEFEFGASEDDHEWRIREKQISRSGCVDGSRGGDRETRGKTKRN